MSSGVTPINWLIPRTSANAESSPATTRFDVEPMVPSPEGTTLPATERTATLGPVAPPGYELLEELGRGGMGVVYKARQKGLDRLVALKMIQTGAKASPEDRERFRIEAEAVARLSHPNVVQIYDVGEHEGCPYFALEFVDGPDLASYLEGRSLPACDAARLVHTLAGAVHHAHQQGIIHRDLKPANILLVSGGVVSGEWCTPGELAPLTTHHPKITDFGLAKHLAGASGLTQSGQVLGTPSYMAPEQAMGERRRMGPANDVYALGAILYELLTGRPPFKGDTPWNTLAAVMSDEVVPPRRHRPDLPAPLEAICLKALARDPARRYASALELAQELNRFLSGATVRARADGWLRRLGRRMRRHLLLLSTMLLLTLLAASFGCFAWWENRRLQGDAAAAMAEGERHLENREYAEAVRSLGRGLDPARQAWDGGELVQSLEKRLAQARRGLAGRELHELADRARFFFEPEALPPGQRQTLESHCRQVWDVRDRLLDRGSAPLDTATEETIAEDLLDLALLWTDLHTRDDSAVAHQEALAVLAEAEHLFGPSAALARQRQSQAVALGLHELADSAARQAEQVTPRTAREHYALGRWLLRAGQLDAAASALERAIAEQPRGFWPHYYRGRCAFQRGKHQEAVEAFNLCVYQAPGTAVCYYNRALPLAALGRDDEALRDYDKALELDSSLAAAALNRGLLHGRRRQYDRAVADLERALELGADPATAQYNLAVIHDRRNDRTAARACVERALHHNPNLPEARELAQKLKKGP